MLVIHAVIITKCRQFLSEPQASLDMRAWRLRFIVLDLFFGLAWMFILIHPVGVEENTGTFMLFVMLLVVAVSSMLASSVPMAMIAATVPVTRPRSRSTSRCAARSRITFSPSWRSTAQGYFSLLAYRLYSTQLGHTGGARGEGRADRRARDLEGDLRRGAATRGGGEYRQIALPRPDEPRAAHAAQCHSRLLGGDEGRDFRPPSACRPTRIIPATFTIPACTCSA